MINPQAAYMRHERARQVAAMTVSFCMGAALCCILCGILMHMGRGCAATPETGIPSIDSRIYPQAVNEGAEL